MVSVDAVVAAGRLAAESLMVDSCRVTRPGSGEPVWDDEAGEYVDPEPVTVYEGACRFQTGDALAGGQEFDAGEAERGLFRSTLQLPVVGSEDVARGHTVTCLSAVHDAALVGAVFTVAGGHVGSQKTSRRLPIEAVQ